MGGGEGGQVALQSRGPFFEGGGRREGGRGGLGVEVGREGREVRREGEVFALVLAVQLQHLCSMKHMVSLMPLSWAARCTAASGPCSPPIALPGSSPPPRSSWGACCCVAWTFGHPGLELHSTTSTRYPCPKNPLTLRHLPCCCYNIAQIRISAAYRLGDVRIPPGRQKAA